MRSARKVDRNVFQGSKSYWVIENWELGFFKQDSRKWLTLGFEDWQHPEKKTKSFEGAWEWRDKNCWLASFKDRNGLIKSLGFGLRAMMKQK